MPTIKITLPKPHENQARFLDSAAKRKIIVAGRRGGKTTAMAMMGINALLHGRRVLEAAPVADQTGAFWDAVTDFARPLIDSGHVRKWDTTRTLEMPLTGGRIRCKTAHNADTLRGDFADLLLLDEYSYMDEDAWTKVGVPMLLDNNGDAVFIFTPNGRNHAYRLYNRAKADDTGRWEAWHFVSSDNPYLSDEALQELTSDMPERDYQQEILAMFLEDGAGLFRHVTEAAMAAPQDAPIRGHQYVMGLDLARKVDYTVLATLDITNLARPALVDLDRFGRVDWPVQIARVKAKVERFRPEALYADATGVGDPIVQQLQHELAALPMVVEGVQITRPRKVNMCNALALAFEQSAIQILPDETLIDELKSFDATTYAAPEGGHDDCVSALYLAYWATRQPAAEAEAFDNNPFYN